MLIEFPEQPEGVRWPTEEWATGEWPDKVDRAAVDQATDLALAGGAEARVRATVVVFRGQIVYERYSPNPADGPDVVMPSYSVAKSFTSALIGILVRDGLLDVDDFAPVPEWHEDPADPRAQITVEHMLHMATGIPWTDDFQRPGTNMFEMVRESDTAAYAASMEPVDDPGATFEYNSGTSTLLARIIGESAGDGPEDTRSFMESELFDKLGMRSTETEFDDVGTWAGSYSADSTARDFARLGLLYVRGGLWDGEQILPDEWVDYSRQPSPANAEYGAHWWLDPRRPDVLYAIGIRGQVITVDPAHDLVIVQLSTVGGELPLQQTEAILEAFAAAD